MADYSTHTVGRLSLYRRLLEDHLPEGTEQIFSHQLAELAGASSAQVRRDLMYLDYEGSPKRGYRVQDLLAALSKALDAPTLQPVALIGMGNLGQAIIGFFSGARPRLAITACFDNDKAKTGQTFSAVPCYHVSQLEAVVARQGIITAIITTPAQAAQAVVDRLVAAGVRGILSYAHVPLKTPPGVFVEEGDMTVALEKTAWFARKA